MTHNSLAGQPASNSTLIDIDRLITAYFERHPDPREASQRVTFGTSGHRGSSLTCSFNEYHLLAVTQAICEYRKIADIQGPLFIGIDTHALSKPAFESAMRVLAGNNVNTFISKGGEFTPTPAVSQAILTYNLKRRHSLADGIVITPSHNPPEDGGIKYNPPNGGPADTDITSWIQNRANVLLETGLNGVKQVPLAEALRADSTQEFDYLSHYVNDLNNIIDFDVIRAAGLHMGVDPLGGAGVHYWARIAETYKLDLTVVSEQIDPQFGFMSLDWDGRIRMDPSSPWAMKRLLSLKNDYDVAFACDTDHDRHGIITPKKGLLPANHYLCIATDYLLRHRPLWHKDAAIGKTLVSSAMINRVAARLGRHIFEVPVGFKWFVPGLTNGALSFAGEESAGAAFSRFDGSVWTTDKDGIQMGLLAAEITAQSGQDLGDYYQHLTTQLGEPFYTRIDSPINAAQKANMAKLTPEQLHNTVLAGDPIEQIISHALGNNAPMGGIKVITACGWFAARPSGTEDIYKLYAESFTSEAHLEQIVDEAQGVLNAVLTPVD